MTLGSSVTKDRHRWVLSSRCDESIAGIVHVLSDLRTGSVDVIELELASMGSFSILAWLKLAHLSYA